MVASDPPQIVLQGLQTTECEYEENQFTGNRPRSYLEIYLLYSYFTFIPSITNYSFYT